MTNVFITGIYSQSSRFTIVNMTPADSSDETNNDGEPTITVNPRNPEIIAASAFTFFRRDRCGCATSVLMPDCRAPIYVSLNSGNTWDLKPVLPSNNGTTHDISLAFGASGSLYAAFLKGCQTPNNVNMGFMVVRIDNPSSNDMGRILYRRFDSSYDQPWIVGARSFNSGTVRPQNDHVFVGINKNGESRTTNFGTRMGTGKTATVMVKNNSDIFNPVVIERIGTAQRNMSGIRVAVHDSGKLYAIFYRWVSGGRSFEDPNGTTSPVCDVVVVKDTHFAESSTSFSSLGTAGDGKIVVSGRYVPISYPGMGILRARLGNERLVGSNLSIAVDPRNSEHIYIAWCDSIRGSYTLHFMRSLNGGDDWENFHEFGNGLKDAINPAIAITTNGILGIAYQKLKHDLNWETHFRLFSARMPHPVPMGHDYVLSRFPDNILRELTSSNIGNNPPLGEYIDLEAIDSTFYGIFCAINTPDPRSFPTERPVYNRQHNFETRQLLNHDRTGIIPPSVDPFFFKVGPIRH